MLFLTWLFFRAPRPVRIIILALLFTLGISTVVRVMKAIQERNAHVHTRSNFHKPTLS
jgi:hypothetical protein